MLLYGLTADSVASDTDGTVLPGAQAQIFTALTGGSLFGQGYAFAGTMTPGSALSNSTVEADAEGRMAFFADGTSDTLFLDFNDSSTRWPVNPTSVSDVVQTKVDAAAADLQDDIDSAVAAQNAAIAGMQETVDYIASLDPQAIAVNVTTFGAQGDGLTDDTAAVQAALDHLDQQGGGVLLLPGDRTYVINGVVQLRDNTVIRGDGATITKTVASPYSVFVALSQGTTGYGSGVRNVKVEGLRFLGSFPDEIMINPLSLHHAADVVVDRCIFEQVQGVGHSLDLAGSENITVRNCTWYGFYNNNTSGYSRTEAVQLDYSAKGGISYLDTTGSYDGLPTRRVTVENCRFLPVTVASVTYPCPNPIGSHSVREGSYFEDIWLTNSLIVDPISHDPNLETYLYGVVHFVAARRIKITGNTFVQTDSTRTNRAVCVVGATQGALVGSDPNTDETEGTMGAPMVCSDIVLDGNEFQGFRPQNASTYCDTLTLRGLSGTLVTNVRVANNQFRGGQNLSGSTAVLKYAIRAHYVDGLTIVGNVIRDDNGGMLVQSSLQVAIQGNSLTGVWFRGITHTSATRVTTTGNTLDGTSAASSIGIQNTSSTNQIVIAHNVITDFATDVNNSTSPTWTEFINANNI